VAEGGATVSEFKPIDAVRLMLDFYEQERVEGCHLHTHGDRLLFQWGTRDCGPAGRHFEFTLIRQLVDREAGDGEHSTQLALTCYFPPTAELAALKAGSQGCDSPDQLAGFEFFIGKTPACKAVGKLRPERVALTSETA
jgi:hypothetical protein